MLLGIPTTAAAANNMEVGAPKKKVKMMGSGFDWFIWIHAQKQIWRAVTREHTQNIVNVQHNKKSDNLRRLTQKVKTSLRAFQHSLFNPPYAHLVIINRVLRVRVGGVG